MHTCFNITSANFKDRKDDEYSKDMQITSQYLLWYQKTFVKCVILYTCYIVSYVYRRWKKRKDLSHRETGQDFVSFSPSLK